MDAVRLLSVIRPHLEGSGGRWALAGGFALAAWGSARTTLDLDLLAEDAGRPRLLPALEAEGFRTLLDSEGFTNLLHDDPALGRLDFVWVEGTTAARIFAAAVERNGPDGLPLLVPAPEHLVAMKVKAIRNSPSRALRDAEDLRVLLSLPGIDQAAARATFERAGLVELYERIRAAS